MRIFHVATAADWARARATGTYTTSTYGVALAEAGFIHASRADQWQAVHQRWYADVAEPLVLLVIDTGRLSAPVVEEAPAGSAETFPHVQGPIETGAVVRVLPLDDRGRPPTTSFSTLFLGEVLHRALLAGVVMVAVLVLTGAGTALDADAGPLLGTAAGLVVGVPLAWLLHRRWERRVDGLSPGRRSARP